MWTLTSFCGWFDIISIATGAHWGSPRPAEVRRQSGRPRTVPGQSPLPGKVLVGVYGPRRASSAWRGAPPPVVGPGGLPRASAVRGGRPLSVAGSCRLSWACCCCCCCCWLLAAAAAVGEPSREITDTNVPVVPLNKKGFKARVLQQNGWGGCPRSSPSTASRGDSRSNTFKT